jgi:hypothetical protein
MTDHSQRRQQQNQQTQDRARQADPPPVSRPEYSAPPPASTTEPAKKSGFKMGEEKRTAGKAGEQNIKFQWIEQWVGNARSARFDVCTAPENGLEVVIQQQSYNRPYVGTGSVATGTIPVAPIGTKGKVICTDQSSGEVFEKDWTWHLIGGGAGMGLWQMIKNLFWKG